MWNTVDCWAKTVSELLLLLWSPRIRSLLICTCWSTTGPWPWTTSFLPYSLPSCAYGFKYHPNTYDSQICNASLIFTWISDSVHPLLTWPFHLDVHRHHILNLSETESLLALLGSHNLPHLRKWCFHSSSWLGPKRWNYSCLSFSPFHALYIIHRKVSQLYHQNISKIQPLLSGSTTPIPYTGCHHLLAPDWSLNCCPCPPKVSHPHSMGHIMSHLCSSLSSAFLSHSDTRCCKIWPCCVFDPLSFFSDYLLCSISTAFLDIHGTL